MVQTSSEFTRPSLGSLADFQDRLQEVGFWSVHAQNTGAAGVLSVDQIFTDSNLQQTIFLKMGLKQFRDYTLTNVAGGIAYQGMTASGSPFVLFFDHISKLNARRISKKFETSDHSAAATQNHASLALHLLIPSASACEIEQPAALQVQSALSDMAGISRFRAGASCVITALQSAQKIALGPLEALKQMVREPEKFWADTKKEWQTFKSFVINVQSELSKFYEFLGHVDAEMAEQIGCSIIGQVAASALTGLAGGIVIGAAAKTAAAIALLIVKLNRLRQVLLTLSRAKQIAHLRSVAGLTREVISCAVH